MNLSLSQFIEIVRARRSTRHFESKPGASELLEQLLEAARWSQSAFNLQPTHFIVVTDYARKEKLHLAYMKQRQILDAGAVVVFTGDRDVVKHHFGKMLRQERKAKSISGDYEELLKKNVPLVFNCGFLGFGFFVEMGGGKTRWQIRSNSETTSYSS